MKMIKVVKKVLTDFGIKDYIFTFNPPPSPCGHSHNYLVYSPLIGNFYIQKGETYEDISERLTNHIFEIYQLEIN